MKSAVSLRDRVVKHVVKERNSFIKPLDPNSPTYADSPSRIRAGFNPLAPAPMEDLEGFSLDLDSLPRPIAKALELLDCNGDGNINVDELTDAVLVFNESKKQNRMLRKLLILASVFLVTVLTANVGLVFAVMYLTKETSTQGDGVMTVAGSATLVRAGSAELLLNGTAMVTEEGKSVSTSTAPFWPMTLSSTLPNEALDELMGVQVQGDNGAFLSLAVLGWVRLPDDQWNGPTPAIKVVTQPGLILINGTALSFEDLVGTVFAEAGFHLDSNSSSLTTSYVLMGMYNSDEWQEGLEEEVVVYAPPPPGPPPSVQI